MDKFGYKIFSYDNGKLKSFYNSSLRGHGITYEFGKRILPESPDAPIFVFENLQGAMRYANERDGVICRVAYKESGAVPRDRFGLSVASDSVFASEICLLYPIWKSRCVPMEIDEEINSNRKVIVI
jgi:hypothetical protein